MLEDRIRIIARSEGWNDKTTVFVLIEVLKEIAQSGQHWTDECIVNAVAERASEEDG